jgi:hypothetical protein
MSLVAVQEEQEPLVAAFFTSIFSIFSSITFLGSITFLLGFIPIFLGFTGGGIASGSIAAAMQAGMGNVAAGSCFATMQSLGATGFFNMLASFAGVCNFAYGYGKEDFTTDEDSNDEHDDTKKDL